MTGGANIASSKLPSLDGWRAISVVMVIGFHSTFATGFPQTWRPAFYWLFDGGMGVRFFFVISGFLITWLLLQEKKRTGSINLKNFYLRRCLRILPVYFAFLGVLAILQCYGLVQHGRDSWLGCITFTRDVFGLGQDPASGHLWSIAVEEQFYLLWPGLLVLLGCGSNVRSVMLTLLFISLLGPLIRGIEVISPEFFSKPVEPAFSFSCLKSIIIRFMLQTDSLIFGCASAILLNHKKLTVQKYVSTRPWPVFLFGSLLVVLPHFFYRISFFPTSMIEFNDSLLAFGFSVLLLQSVILPGWGVYRCLNNPWIMQVGVLSYSLYIWQQLFWTAPKISWLEPIWWNGFWVPPLILTVCVSYYGLERPLLKIRDQLRGVKLSSTG